jgi:hypothetical protein
MENANTQHAYKIIALSKNCTPHITHFANYYRDDKTTGYMMSNLG